MSNTLLFGNGLNRLSSNAVSWSQLLDSLKVKDNFPHNNLPYTMVYEQIFMGTNSSDPDKELSIKNEIAKALTTQNSNEVMNRLASMNFSNFITTNYDYAFSEVLNVSSEKLSTEDIYSLRRKRKFGDKILWHAHGEIDHPKSIMLGLDHYCGSVGKIDAYVKGKYSFNADGKTISITSIEDKIINNAFCNTSWIDLFFSTNVHILGFSLDFSEIDFWWLLNKRARLHRQGKITNQIYLYVTDIEDQKEKLLNSFNINVIKTPVVNDKYEEMYLHIIEEMRL